MISNKLFVVFYMFVAMTHLKGCFRRWSQPLLRGTQWFFEVKVQPDFYSGAGKKILDRYRTRMLGPLAIEVLCVAAIFVTGHFAWLPWLCIAAGVLIHVNHAFSVDRAEGEARKFAVPEAEQPVAQVHLSLKTRRLRDYSNPKLETALALAFVAGTAWLAPSLLHGPSAKHPTLLFWVPFYFLYLHLGMLYAKCVIVAWRSPVPQEQAEEHLRVREERRKFYLQSVDWGRTILAAQFLFTPVMFRVPRTSWPFVGSIWLAGLLAIGLVQVIWTENHRKRIREMAARLEPQKLPDFHDQPKQAGWLLCYQPSVPTLVLKGTRGYSLNLANGLTQLGAAYVAGYVALTMLPRLLGH